MLCPLGRCGGRGASYLTECSATRTDRSCPPWQLHSGGPEVAAKPQSEDGKTSLEKRGRAGVDTDRWIGEDALMAYRAPAWFTRRVFNPIAMRTGMSGVKPLSVRRRRSGGTQEIPVIPVEVDGVRYLVSPRGETEWVRNLRASGGAGALQGTPFTAAEVPVPERGPILAAYQKLAGRAVTAHFKALPQAEDHPVFRL